MLSNLFKRRGNKVPFKADLLFHFFNDKTQITDTYLLDPVSGLKLYPKQSSCIKGTAVNTGIAVPVSVLENTSKVRTLFKHKLSEVENFGYIWAGANASAPLATTGLYLTSGQNAYSSLWFGSTAGACAILTSTLEDDNWYLCTQFIADTISMKMNKVTNVNNALVIDSDINSSTTAKGTETLLGTHFGILTGVYNNNAKNYGSRHQVAYIEFLDSADQVIFRVDFSEGNGDYVYDRVSGTAYRIANVTELTIWANKQDLYHGNFVNGFTEYYNSAEARTMRLPHKLDGTEITPSAVPSGYVKVADREQCKETFNQCENVFVLDNVDVVSGFVVSGSDQGCDGTYTYVADFGGKGYYDDGNNHRIYWDVSVWKISTISPVVGQHVGTGDTVTPDLATWTAPLTVELAEQSPLYAADVDFVLFTENTGVAKEIEIQDLEETIFDDEQDRGYLYISSDSKKNLMLYETDKVADSAADFKIIKYVD